MKKVIFAAVSAILMSGCADLPQNEGAYAGVREQTYETTGSRIPRKASSMPRSDASIVDKEEVDRQVRNQGTVSGLGQ
ncbi:membrane lipoprotein lipid attachment site-containing protein [Pseudoduganella sp. HUAS MS19]